MILVKYKSHRFYYDQFDSADRLFLAPFYNNNNDPNHEAKSYLLLDALRKNCVQEVLITYALVT